MFSSVSLPFATSIPRHGGFFLVDIQQIEGRTWPMYNNYWNNKNPSNCGVNIHWLVWRIAFNSWTTWNTTQQLDLWQTYPKHIMHSATQKDSFGSIKFPSSAGTLNIWYRCCDAIDLYIIELIINSNYREYATKSSNMSSALHRWSATNHHQEPEVHQQDIDGVPMWEQPRRTTPWCGNVVFFHNFDPASDSDWALKQSVAQKSSWLQSHVFPQSPTFACTDSHLSAAISRRSDTPTCVLLPTPALWHFSWSQPTWMKNPPTTWKIFTSTRQAIILFYTIWTTTSYWKNRWQSKSTSRTNSDFGPLLKKPWMFWNGNFDLTPVTYHTSLGISTSELTKKVDYLMNHIAQMRVSSQDFLPKRTMNHDTQPVWLVNRLLEEVKQGPPFRPSLPRRHSFNWVADDCQKSELWQRILCMNLRMA